VKKLAFTGERVVPGVFEARSVFQEHVARYAFAAHYVQGAAVLDVACGTGYGARHLADRGASFVVGVDIAVDALDYCREHYQGDGVYFAAIDAPRLGFPDDTFQVVVSLETIEHLADAEAYLAEIRRVMSPNGLLVLSTPNRITFSPNPDEAASDFHFREYSAQELKPLLGRHFSQVVLCGQRNVGAIMIYQLAEPGGDGESAPWPTTVGMYEAGAIELALESPGAGAEYETGSGFGEPDYLIAVCSNGPIEPQLPSLGILNRGYFFSPEGPLETNLKECRDEMAKRVRWIAWLEESISYRDNRIRELEEAILGIQSHPAYRIYQAVKRWFRMGR